MIISPTFLQSQLSQTKKKKKRGFPIVFPHVFLDLNMLSTLCSILFFFLLLGSNDSIAFRQKCSRTFRLAASNAADASPSLSGIKSLLQQEQVISRDTAYLMITVLSASKDWAALDDTINTLRTTHQVELDTLMWDSIVIGAAKSDPNVGKKYYNKMLKHGPQLSINMTMYETLLKSYSRVENWKEIAVFYQSMLSRQDELMDQVGLGFYEIALSYCARRGRYKEAVFWQDELKRRGLTPSHKAYRLTIDACNKGGKPKLAMSYIDAMLVAFADEGSIDFEFEEKTTEGVDGVGDDDS